uniref:Uncharacterized protein n=1 Tax=Picea sitchensis TaxID=3332 RepID=A0A6B9XU87_PICSI|nr:hypothetical protein Q903MT_gene3827 [Picea sitchensis]
MILYIHVLYIYKSCSSKEASCFILGHYDIYIAMETLNLPKAPLVAGVDALGSTKKQCCWW